MLGNIVSKINGIVWNPGLVALLLTKKKSLKLTWKKVSNITGYKLQIAKKKSFKKAKTYTVKKTTKTIKKLKRKKTYYLRIRTYKLVKSSNKEIYTYSDWSKVVKKKVK